MAFDDVALLARLRVAFGQGEFPSEAIFALKMVIDRKKHPDEHDEFMAQWLAACGTMERMVEKSRAELRWPPLADPMVIWEGLLKVERERRSKGVSK